MYTVYKHTCPNGKCYIGITSKEPTKRWQNGTGYHHNEYWKSAIQKYGWENIKHEVLFDGLTKEQAEAKEIELIAECKSNQREYGYNMASGGGVNKGYALSEETKRKLSIAHTGKRCSDEHKEKMSIAHKGRTVSQETRDKISVANKGRKLTEQAREKMSLARKGKKQSQSLIDKRTKAITGQKRTIEQIEKMRANRPNKKAVLQFSQNGELLNCYSSIAEAARCTGVCRSKISLVCLHKRKKAGGFIWRIEEENQNTKPLLNLI